MNRPSAARAGEHPVRHDLTGAQRKAFAAEAGRLVEIMRLRGNEENFPASWFDDISTHIGITRRTLVNWWHAFCGEAGLALTPRQALAAQGAWTS